MRIEEFTGSIFASIGAFFGIIFGPLNENMIALLVVVALDYISGVIAAYILKKLSSKQGFKGFAKKVALLLLVGAGHILDKVLALNGMLQTAVIYYYIANEILSIIENCGNIGLPIPKRLIDALSILQKEKDS